MISKESGSKHPAEILDDVHIDIHWSFFFQCILFQPFPLLPSNPTECSSGLPSRSRSMTESRSISVAVSAMVFEGYPIRRSRSFQDPL